MLSSLSIQLTVVGATSDGEVTEGSDTLIFGFGIFTFVVVWLFYDIKAALFTEDCDGPNFFSSRFSGVDSNLPTYIFNFIFGGFTSDFNNLAGSFISSLSSSC